MSFWSRVRLNIKQIYSITEKNIKVTLRYKLNLITNYIMPFFQLILPLIIMGKIFSFQSELGPWTAENYFVYILIGYNILLFQRIIFAIGGQLSTEKYWQTLEALIIAPFNRFNLLLGYLISHLIEISLPAIAFFVICYIVFPISILSLFVVILLFFSVLLIFTGVGLIIAIFAISNENIQKVLAILIQLLFSFSCISYPFQLFPRSIQFFINLNPIYHIIDIVRLVWVENNLQYSFAIHYIQFLIIISCVILFPIAGILIFNYIFKKYGIRGY